MTKRIISMLLVFLMLVAMISCSGDNVQNGDNTTDTNTSAAVEQGSESETEPAEPYTFTGDFKVGYARVDITPTEPIPLNTGDILSRVNEELYATCIAIKSGKEIVVLVSLDIKNMGKDTDKNLKSKVKIATGADLENIVINTMHNHSAPCLDAPTGNSAITKWRNDVFAKVSDIAKEAVADLSDARPYIGVGKSTNLASVRRYIYEDGSCRTNGPAPIVKHETEADDNIQIIRFVRENKKDVVMANWQAHVAHAIGADPGAISGDYVYYARKTVEDGNDDALFAFFLGAAGNINLNVRIKELNRAGGSYVAVGKQLGQEILKTLDDGMTPVNADYVKSQSTVYKGTLRASTEDEYNRAKAFMALGLNESDPNYQKKLEEYGFEATQEMNLAYRLYNRTGTKDMNIGAISIGDISFVWCGYEMFDTNGMEIKAATPDKMTFILAYSGDALGYIPSINSVPNGSYEVYASDFKYGTGEEVAQKLITLLEYLDRQ